MKHGKTILPTFWDTRFLPTLIYPKWFLVCSSTTESVSRNVRNLKPNNCICFLQLCGACSKKSNFFKVFLFFKRKSFYNKCWLSRSPLNQITTSISNLISASLSANVADSKNMLLMWFRVSSNDTDGQMQSVVCFGKKKNLFWEYVKQVRLILSRAGAMGGAPLSVDFYFLIANKIYDFTLPIILWFLSK